MLVGCVECNHWGKPGDKNFVLELMEEDLKARKQQQPAVAPVPVPIWSADCKACDPLKAGRGASQGLRLSMTRSQLIAGMTLFGLGLAFVSSAWADPASDVCAALVDARDALYAMAKAKDKSAQDALNAKVQAASTKLDSVLAGMTGADAKRAADFKAVWDQFKDTRDKEIIPAIYKGNTDDAEKLINGVQLTRFGTMWGVMSCKIR